MYLDFFGFQEKPFELLPNPEYLYLSRTHQRAIRYLEYGLQQHAGFMLLTGEVGAGKTTLIRRLINQAQADMVLSRVFNTAVDAQQLIALINEDFGLSVTHKNKVELLRDLNDFLIQQVQQKRRPMVIIDEAQNLSEEALEEVRLLSNLEADSFKLLQIVLAGQPELKQKIAQPSLRQLRQRLNVVCHLGTLAPEEIQQYIRHRLSRAGNPNAISFPQEVLKGIAAFSQGVPRLINLACDYMLLCAFVEEQHEVSLAKANEVMGELSLEDDALPQSAWQYSPAPQAAAPFPEAATGVEAKLDGMLQELEHIKKTLILSVEHQENMLKALRHVSVTPVRSRRNGTRKG